MKLSTAKKIHPETGGWFLEAYSVMTNFRAKVTNSIAKGTNSIAKWTNSIAKVTNSIAKWTNSIAKTCNLEVLPNINTAKSKAARSVTTADSATMELA